MPTGVPVVAELRLWVSEFWNIKSRKIDEGRYQHKCKVDFQGHPISWGIGHNKNEAKKDAAANSLKVVAPTIYKELLAGYVSPADMSKESHKKVSETPAKLLGQKRIEAPTPELDASLQEEDDSLVRLSNPKFLKRKTLFKQQTPYTVIYNLLTL